MFDSWFARKRWKSAGLGRPPGTPGGPTSPGAVDDEFLGRLRRVSLASLRGPTGGKAGEHPSPRRAHSLEFADYRSYSPGDDLRQVDWNAYLRLDHLLVKLADAPERMRVQILLDSSRSMAFGQPDKFSYARRVALGLAYVALAHMDAANLYVLTGGDCRSLPYQHGTAAMGSLVRAVGGLEARGTTNLDATLSGFAALGNNRGAVVLISDLLSPTGYQAGLERLVRTGLRPVIIHLLSPEEMSPNLEGDVELQDVETGESVQVSLDLASLKRYERTVRNWLNNIELFCTRRGIVYLRVETTIPVENLLLDRLRRERVLR